MNTKQSLCFSTLGCTEKSLDEILALAQKYSIGALEIRGIGGVLDNRQIADFSIDKMENTKKKFEAAGVEPLVVGASCAFHNPEKIPGAIEEGKACILIAQALGAKYIRVFGNDLVGDPAECIRNVVQGISTLCDFALSTEVKVLLEVHGDFNRIETLSPVLEALGKHPRFGLIWDIAHSNRVYGENWLPFFEKVFPYVCHVHIKDADATGLTLPGKGTVPFKDIQKKLLSCGYRGAFSLEWEKKWHPELEPLEIALPEFVKVMEKDCDSPKTIPEGNLPADKN